MRIKSFEFISPIAQLEEKKLIQGEIEVEADGAWLIIEDELWEKGLEISRRLIKSIWQYKSKKYNFIDRSSYERQKRIKKEDNQEKDRGIYGLYQNGKLIYIGKTIRSFEERIKEHSDVINGRVEKPQGMILYNLIQPEDTITWEILLNIKDLKVEGKISNRDLEAIELGLISIYKPKGNWQGVKGNYRFS